MRVQKNNHIGVDQIGGEGDMEVDNGTKGSDDGRSSGGLDVRHGGASGTKGAETTAPGEDAEEER